MVPTANRPTINAARIQSPSVLGERFVTSRAWGLMYNGLIGSVNGLISFLRHSFTTARQSSQTVRIQPLQPRRGAHFAGSCRHRRWLKRLGSAGRGRRSIAAAGLRQTAGQCRPRRGKDGAGSLSRSLTAAGSRHDGNGASAARRRHRGRSASAGPRERRDKGSRRTQPSDP